MKEESANSFGRVFMHSMRTSLMAVALLACIEMSYVLLVGRITAGFTATETALFALHLVGTFALCGTAVALTENAFLAMLLRVESLLNSPRLRSALLVGSVVALLLPAALFAATALSGGSVAYWAGGGVLVSGIALFSLIRFRSGWLDGLNVGAVRLFAYSLFALQQVLSLVYYLSLFDRMQRANYRALALGCFALLSIACWVLAFGLRWLASRKLEGGWGNASRSVVCVGAVAALALTAGAYLSDRVLFPGLYDDIHWFLKLLTYLSAQATIVLGADAFWRLFRPKTRLVAAGKRLMGVAIALSVVAAGHSVAFFGSSHVVTQACQSEALVTADLTGALRAVSDSDGDGYSSLFGGGDCDDRNPEVHPGRSEVFDNGIDDNCHGGDLTKEKVNQREKRRRDARRERTHWWNSRPEASRRRLNVVIITIDTLRADHVGYQGYDRETTPRMDRLARESVIFRNAYCAGGSTSISLPSLMTGIYPSGLRLTSVYEDSQSHLWFAERMGSEVTPVQVFTVPSNDKNPTLSQLLGDAGYHTVALLNDGETNYLRREFGISRGFDILCTNDSDECNIDQSKRLKRTTAEEVTRRAIEQLDNVPQDGPFFMWIHHFDPHNFRSRRGRTQWGNTVVDKYDAQIAETDRYLGVFLDELARRGLMNETVVVVSSDHGEAFGEHGLYHHGDGGYEEMIHVPLLFRFPNIRPREVTEAVSLVDVVPTLLDYLSIQRDELLSGRSLLPSIWGEHIDDEGGVVSMSWRCALDGTRKNSSWTLIEGRYKLIYGEIGHHFALYDLNNDPNERINLAGSENATFLSMRETLLGFVERGTEGCVDSKAVSISLP
jgi:arylsulfatase A-like enzyme